MRPALYTHKVSVTVRVCAKISNVVSTLSAAALVIRLSVSADLTLSVTHMIPNQAANPFIRAASMIAIVPNFSHVAE